MRPPADDVTRFWGLASEKTALGASIIARSAEAPLLSLANFLYAVDPQDTGQLDRDLTQTPDHLAPVPRVVMEPDTPAWVEAELLLRGWRAEQEFRLILPSSRGLTRSPTAVTEICEAKDVDPDWSVRGAMFRADHLEEDKRRGQRPRPPAHTDAVIRQRRQLERQVTYLGVAHQGGLAGFLCIWRTPEGRGVIEDVFVHPRHRGGGLATTLLCYATRTLRAAGAGEIMIAAEVGDTPVQLYAGLGFDLSSVARCYARP